MLTILNNSDTVIIVLHEIYGVNQHIKRVCEYYSKAGFDIICPDLINQSQPFKYVEEDLAYSYFKKNIGFEIASDQVRRMLSDIRKRYKHIFLLGFSIGATIAWICSDSNDRCDGVIGYYGSRIRDYQSVVPKCPVVLIYPKEEKSFMVQELVDNLRGHEDVDIYMLEGKHGFSDIFSMNYLKESHEKSIILIDDFINRIKAKQ